jgi:hypothetical protein
VTARQASRKPTAARILVRETNKSKRHTPQSRESRAEQKRDKKRAPGPLHDHHKAQWPRLNELARETASHPHEIDFVEFRSIPWVLDPKTLRMHTQ